MANQILICLVKIIGCCEQGILHIDWKSEYSLLHLVKSPLAKLSLLQQSVLVFQCATSSQWAQDCNYHTWEAKTETESDTGILGLHSEIWFKIKCNSFLFHLSHLLNLWLYTLCSWCSVGYLLRVMSWYLIVLDHFYTKYSQSLNTLECKEVLWDRKKRKKIRKLTLLWPTVSTALFCLKSDCMEQAVLLIH